MVRWMVALLLLALLTGCVRTQQGQEPMESDGQSSGIKMELHLAEKPTLGAVSSLEMTLTRAGQPITGAVVQVEGAMSHAGMEPLLVEATEMGEGAYQAQLAWSMAGEWIVTARATLTDGSIVWESLESVEVLSP